MRECPQCHGSGEVHGFGYATNPFSGVQVNDPQMEESAPCPRCDGEGVLDDRFDRVDAPSKKHGPQEAENAA